MDDAAAWVQVSGSLLAVFAAVGIAAWGHFRQDQIDKKDRHRAHQSNTAKIANIESAGVVILDALCIKEEDEVLHIPIGRLRTVQSNINRVCDIVDQLILQESSDVAASFHSTAYILAGRQLSLLIDTVCENPLGIDKGASGTAFINSSAMKDLRDSIKLMKDAQKATHNFAKRLLTDPRAKPSEVELTPNADNKV